jgi:nitrogen fixation NifU-like protein
MYSEAVLEHFRHPRNVGELADATVAVEVSNPVCGDVMRLAVRLENGRVAEARYQARGCTTAIACGSLLTTLLTGKKADEVKGITAQQISEALGGLPPATFHGSQLACDALEALLLRLR